MAGRRQYDATYKARVALEAVKGEKTLVELSSEYQVHCNQISKWKRKLLDELPGIFSKKKQPIDLAATVREEELLRQIGKLSLELEWVKKKVRILS